MDYEDCKSELEKMSIQEQILFLSLIGHGLTIAARGTYEFQGPGVTKPTQLRELNEIQHRIYSQLSSLARGGKPAFPPDALARWLVGDAASELRGALSYALESAREALQRA